MLEDYSPAVKYHQFRSLAFDKELQILLPLVSEKQIDLSLLKVFLDYAKQGTKGKIHITPELMIDLELHQICVKGFMLENGLYICSSNGDLHTLYYSVGAQYSIYYKTSEKDILTTLEYLYHMITSV